MVSVDYDLQGVKKMIVLGLGLMTVAWFGELSGLLMFFLAAYYATESHFYYLNGFKPYRRLGSHLQRAVKR